MSRIKRNVVYHAINIIGMIKTKDGYRYNQNIKIIDGDILDHNALEF